MNENEEKYLVYHVGNETYGSPLLSVREVLEYSPPKPMPNMVSSFVGVINVRGSIVGVIDLRKAFGVPAEVTGRAAMLLCDTPSGPIASVVDKVDSVAEFFEKDIEKNPASHSRTHSKYLIGVAKREKELVTLVDLHCLLSESELKSA